MPTYYDLVLGLIPVTVISIAGAASLFGAEASIAVGAGSLLATTLVAHALFINPPMRHAHASGHDTAMNGHELPEPRTNAPRRPAD